MTAPTPSIPSATPFDAPLDTPPDAPLDATAALQLGGQRFLERVRLVAPDTLLQPSTCDGWTVGDLVEHVVTGCRMAVALLDGATKDEALAVRALTVEGDLADAAGAAIERQLTAFARGDLDTIVVQHPVVEMTGVQLRDQRIVEFVVHGWDLARSADLDDTIDAHLGEIGWAAMAPLGEIVGALGVFGAGPSGRLGDDVAAADRLLDLTGRRP